MRYARAREEGPHTGGSLYHGTKMRYARAREEGPWRPDSGLAIAIEAWPRLTYRERQAVVDAVLALDQVRGGLRSHFGGQVQDDGPRIQSGELPQRPLVRPRDSR